MEASSQHELLTGTLSINSNKQINYLDTLAKVGFLAIFSDQGSLWLDDNILIWISQKHVYSMIS